MEVVVSSKPLIACSVSLLAVAPIILSRRHPNLREGWTFLAGFIKLGIVLSMLPVILQGGLASLAITEPTAGSDATGMKTRFTPEGDAIIVEGTKNFITNGDVADLYLLFCARPGAGPPELIAKQCSRSGSRLELLMPLPRGRRAKWTSVRAAQ